MAKIVLMLLLAAASPARADQSSSNAYMGFGVLRPAPPADPYRKLFEPQGAEQKPVENARAKADLKPARVCGMTIIAVDPAR